MNNIKLILAYDGNRYCGWQKSFQGLAIENVLQDVLEKILQHPLILQAASRTDAGVHATHQVVNFFTPLPLNLERFKLSVNALLPKDIVILSIDIMPLHFHPTLDCKSKEYHYYMCYGPTQLPQHRFYSWHYHYSIDIEKMRQASLSFLGTHDFTSFCNVSKTNTYSHYIRTIDEIKIEEMEPDRLRIQVKGANFLYRMVRNIVGTLAYVGNGKIQPSQLSEILQAKDRRAAGITAPAHGLFLHKIIY